MYLKLKKIKGIEYAYLVSQSYNKKRKKTRQKNNYYLGKVIQFDRSTNLDFNTSIKGSIHDFISEHSQRQIFGALIHHELINHGFKWDLKKEFLVKGNLYITKGCKKFKDINNNSKFCLEINDGFLSSHSIDTLLSPLPLIEDQVQGGNILAKRLRSEGLNPSTELFISLFKKIVDS